MSIERDKFVVVSDFHGYDWPLDKIKKYYLNEYDKIFILGDATDRGTNGYGIHGIKLLCEIMELSKNYPKRVIYIPGNHDDFVYKYAAYCDEEAKYLLTINGGADTINDINALENDNSAKLDELVSWLGNLPLQRVHSFRGKTYVLAHAFFDQALYRTNPDLSLRDTGTRALKYGDIFNILWFRLSKDSYNPKKVPPGVIEVIGHTPARYRQGQNLDLVNRFGEKTKVVCVDGGIAYDGKMSKYDGGEDSYTTLIFSHHNTSDTNPCFDDVQQQLVSACVETMREFGSKQVSIALTGVLNNYYSWYIGFASDVRKDLTDLGQKSIVLAVQKTIDSLGFDSHSLNTKQLVNTYLGYLYSTNEEFSNIFQEEQRLFQEKQRQERERETEVVSNIMVDTYLRTNYTNVVDAMNVIAGNLSSISVSGLSVNDDRWLAPFSSQGQKVLKDMGRDKVASILREMAGTGHDIGDHCFSRLQEENAWLQEINGYKAMILDNPQLKEVSRSVSDTCLRFGSNIVFSSIVGLLENQPNWELGFSQNEGLIKLGRDKVEGIIRTFSSSDIYDDSSTIASNYVSKLSQVDHDFHSCFKMNDVGLSYNPKSFKGYIKK